MIALGQRRRKRIRCWFGIHEWGMYWSHRLQNYQDRCNYCNRPKRK